MSELTPGPQTGRAPRPRTSLFREEVAREQSRRLWGEVILVQPLGARILTPVLALLLFAIAAFVTFQKYPRTETVPGYLAADVGTSKLHAPRPGTVSALFVQVGDYVKKGDVLLTASTDAALAEGEGLRLTRRRELIRQQEELEQKLAATEELHAQAMKRWEQQTEGLRAQVAQLEALRELVVERCKIADAKAEAFRVLHDDRVVSPVEYRDRRDAALAVHAERGRLESTLIEKRDELQSIEASLASGPVKHQQDQADLRMALSQVANQLTESESQASFAIKAPVSGRVAALQAAPGTALTPELPVAMILPRGGRLQAHLLVPTRAIGFVEPGQRVGLKYAAFPYQQFGIHGARVIRVDGTVMTPGELQTPVETTEPVYRLIAELDEQTMRAYGARHALRVGMLLEAEIVLEERTILQWLLEPLHSLRGRA